MPLKESRIGTAVLPRLMGCMLRQRQRALLCPKIGPLDDRLIAITGATSGIGLETARHLIAAGAWVLFLVRNERKAQSALEALGEPRRVTVVPLDLSDLSTIPPAVSRVQALGRPIDTLIENAGVSPHHYAQTQQGYESAFGTNVLGHFALRQALLKSGALQPTARVVIVTGDIYITASDCTADYRYRTMIGGSFAYSRSKLGNAWIANALHRRYPSLSVTLVHPGVVNSGLMMGDSLIERLLKKPLLPTALGAQTSLYCATQSVKNGGYYHNTFGLAHLSPDDPALDERKQDALWQACEQMAAPYLQAIGSATRAGSEAG